MIALAILALLQVADALTTRRVLDAGGRELNPILRAAFDKFGFWPAIAIKSTFVVGLGSLLPFWPLIALCAFYGAIVAHNLRQSA